jgi:hypothetical protein
MLKYFFDGLRGSSCPAQCAGQLGTGSPPQYVWAGPHTSMLSLPALSAEPPTKQISAGSQISMITNNVFVRFYCDDIINNKEQSAGNRAGNPPHTGLRAGSSETTRDTSKHSSFSICGRAPAQAPGPATDLCFVGGTADKADRATRVNDSYKMTDPEFNA